MTDFWVSTGKYWCEWCEQYVTNNANQRKLHEISGKHTRNVERSLASKRRERMKDQPQQQPQSSHPRPGSMRGEPPRKKEKAEEAVVDGPVYDPSVGSVVEREAPKPEDNYDPSNPYGKWVEASPPKSEEEEEPGQRSRAGPHEDEDADADDALQDADSDFEVKKMTATSLKRDEDSQGDVDDENGDGDDVQVTFKQKKSSRKTRSTRLVDTKRDINE